MYIKGLQRASNFENDSTPGVLEPRLNALAHNAGGMAEAVDFFLRTPTLTTNNFAALLPADFKFSVFKDLSLFVKSGKISKA